MALWRDKVLPRIVDAACGMDDVRPWRETACAGLRGRVLEIGFGSGHNIGLYPAAVTRVDAVEPSDAAWRLSEERRRDSAVPIERTGLDGEALAAADDSYDSVLVTFTLCTIPDAAAALREVRRVLVPGGSLHFAEHGLSPDPGVARWQHRLDPLEQRLLGGCHLTRHPPRMLAEAGFEVTELLEEYAPGPGFLRPWNYGYAGAAAPV